MAMQQERDPDTNRFLPYDWDGRAPVRVDAVKRAFLAALTDGCSVRAAAERASIHTYAAYRWRETDPEFAAAWDAARETVAYDVEHGLVRRALDPESGMAGTVAGIAIVRGQWPARYSPERQAAAQVNVTVQAQVVLQAAAELGLTRRLPASERVIDALPEPEPEPEPEA